MLQSDLKLIREWPIQRCVSSIFGTFFDDASLFFELWHSSNGGSEKLSISKWCKMRDDDLLREQVFKVCVAARESSCIETHHWHKVSEEEFWFEAKNHMSGIPFADLFSVEFRIIFKASGKGACNAFASAGVHFSRPVPLSRRISHAAASQYCKSFENMQRLMENFSVPTLASDLVSRVQTGLLTVCTPIQAQASFILECTTETGFLGLQDKIVCICDSACIWTVQRGRDPSVFSLRHEESGRFLGHDFLGNAVASATRQSHWEQIRLEEHADKTVILIDADWNFRRGAYLIVQRKASLRRLVCAHGVGRSACAARFCFRLVPDGARSKNLSGNLGDESPHNDYVPATEEDRGETASLSLGGFAYMAGKGNIMVEKATWVFLVSISFIFALWLTYWAACF